MLKTISIDKIIPDPKQPRQYFNEEDLIDLKQSVQSKGILTPILIESNYEGNNFLILDGERRYRCAKELSFKEVPAIIIEGPLTFEERTIKRFHVQEQHKNWNIFDKARAMYMFKKTTNCTISELANKLNQNIPQTHNWLSITEFSDLGQQEIIANKISYTYLFNLIKIIKNYQLLTNIEKEEIEQKLINKFKKGEFKTIIDIQKLSRLMSSSEYSDLKLKFLNDSEYTLKELFVNTNTLKNLTLEELDKNLDILNKIIMTIENEKYILTEKHKKELMLIHDKMKKII